MAQMMACRLVAAEPLSELMLIYFELHPCELCDFQDLNQNTTIAINTNEFAHVFHNRPPMIRNDRQT